MVMSGKGGVGKSTVSVNLAVGLSLEGKKVGILDADIHGPNVPQMLGVEGSKITDIRKPYEISSTLSAVSLSFYMDNSDKPIVFRGPAKSGAIREILSNVDWGDLDYLIVGENCGSKIDKAMQCGINILTGDIEPIRSTVKSSF